MRSICFFSFSKGTADKIFIAHRTSPTGCTGTVGNKKSERAVSRVLFSRSPGSSDHLSGPLDCSKARATYPEVSDGPSLLPLARETLPYVALLQAGFSKHSRSPGNLVGSYPTVSPLPLYRGGLLFCGTVHGVAPCPVSGPPCPAELGLSSPRFRGAITSPALICTTNRNSEVKIVSACIFQSALNLLIYRLVRQRIRFLVHLPRNVLYLGAPDLCNQFLDLPVERLQAFVLYLVLAVQLLHEKLRIGKQSYLRGAALDRVLKPDDRGGVFRDIVRRLSQVPGYPSPGSSPSCMI